MQTFETRDQILSRLNRDTDIMLKAIEVSEADIQPPLTGNSQQMQNMLQDAQDDLKAGRIDQATYDRMAKIIMGAV